MRSWLDNPELRRRALVERFERPACRTDAAALAAYARGNPGLAADARTAACADAFQAFIAVAGGKIAGARFAGDGCVVSVTAADVFLESLRGLTLRAAAARADAFLALAERGRAAPGLPEAFSLFDRVHAQPGRVACAALVCRAAKTALEAALGPEGNG